MRIGIIRQSGHNRIFRDTPADVISNFFRVLWDKLLKYKAVISCYKPLINSGRSMAGSFRDNKALSCLSTLSLSLGIEPRIA